MNYITNKELFNKLMKREILNLSLSNDDGFDFIKLILNKGQLRYFKIIINDKPGITLFQKL